MINHHRSRIPMLITWLLLIFLYTPMIVVGIASFNVSKYGGKWLGFSLKWYEQLFQSNQVWEALYTTLIIALISTFFSTVLGVVTALALYRCKGKGRAVL